MDSQYLNKNVGAPLSEAISAMLVAAPEDKIDYIGNYLLQFVQRRRLRETRAANSAAVDAKLHAQLGEQAIAEKAALERRQEAAMKQSQYPQFLDSIRSMKSKQEAMDGVTAFVASYFDLPSCSIALKRPAGESEVLNYLSANPDQASTIVGKKIMKPAEEGEEAPPRQGVSFDAFKLPEVPEGEPEADEEGNPIVRPPPQPQPLVIDNVMRERRMKFFGIPKLGSYLAIPLSYKSSDHEAAVQVVPPEEGQTESTLAVNKINQDLIIACDTIGKFRRFTAEEIDRIKAIGGALTSVLESIEATTYDAHIEFLNSYKTGASSFAEEAAKLPEAEAAALAAVATELTVDPSIDPPPEPAPETLKPHKETMAVLALWVAAMGVPEVISAVTALQGHLLPLPLPACNLFYALGLILGAEPASMKNVCGDISWEHIRLNLLPQLPSLFQAYSCIAPRSAAVKEATFASTKAFFEAGNLSDASQFPATVPVLGLLSQFCQKALAAREAAIMYFKEAQGQALEA